ncbi:suppressor of fused domain protein [Spirillospora sp. CA-294931]|uniref:suppressor of fused domain protein n=1 Tax=Spirillospora sp. CA-294931 TaxID=3240042 RepID=UPI003D90B6C4
MEALEVVWFEEGDGVAVLEAGDPLCVIPGWADIDRGIPGYSRDALRQSPFAFPLADEIDDLRPRIKRARDHWRVCSAEGSWADYQQSVLGHLLHRLGPGGQYWHDVGRQSPTVGVSERPARKGREYSVLSTVGMSRQPMPGGSTRIELAMATTIPSQGLGKLFAWIGPRPWRSVSSFASGDVVGWPRDGDPFPIPSREGVLLLDDPNLLEGPDVPDLGGLSQDGDDVRWLWMVPITAEECRYATSEGTDALIHRLTRQGRSWLVSDGTASDEGTA